MTYQKAYLATLIDNIEDAIWLVDVNLQTLDINPAACRLLGYNLNNEAMPAFQLVDGNIHQSHQVLRDQLKRTLTEQQQHTFLQALSSDNGATYIVEGSTYPLLDQGKLMGAIAIFRPVSPEKDAERLQADFIAMASHNLRTPLMSIQTALDYVLETNVDSLDNKQYLIQARVQNQKIATVLQELLNIAQLTVNRQIPLRLKPIDLRQLICTIITDLNEVYAEINYDLDMTEDMGPVLADEGKTAIVIQNLITHAHNRCPDNEPLRVVVQEVDSEIVISIVDSGPALPLQQYQQIFWQVYPLEPELYGGKMPHAYGLGLFGTRLLVELLGGRIWISSEQECKLMNSQGLSLNFTLPIRRELYATNFNNR